MARLRHKRLLIAGTALMLAIGSFFLWRTSLDLPVTTMIPPSPPLPVPNAFDDYMQAERQIVHACDTLKIYWDGGDMKGNFTLAERDQVLAATRPGLDILRQGFVFQFQAPADPSAGFSFWGIRPKQGEHELYNGLGTYLKFAEKTNMMHSAWNDAMTCELDALRFGADLPLHDTTSGFHKCVWIQRNAQLDAWNTIPHLTAVPARAAVLRMQDIVNRQISLTDNLLETKRERQAWFVELFQQPEWRKELQDSYGNRTLQDIWEDIKEGSDMKHYVSFASASQRGMFNDYSDYMGKAIAESRKPYASRKPIPNLSGPLSIVDPDFQNLSLEDTFNETQNAFLLVALALQAYQVEHGAYPATLAALVPAYLPAIPADPFARAGSLKYILGREQYVLYSVGPDGKDDGGRPIKNFTFPSGSRAYVLLDAPAVQGDIVAGINIVPLFRVR